MADSKTRICCVCRKKYQYCPNCKEDRNKEPWHFSFCDSNCKDIYDLTSKFENGQIDGIYANEKIKQLDLSRLDNFGDSYKNSIARIVSVAEKIDTAKLDLSENTIEECIKDADVEKSTDTEKVNKTRGRKKQTDVE